MNQINPLHIGGLLLVILIFSIFNLNGLKKELVESNATYKVSEILATDLKSLKDVYSNKQNIKSSIDRMLSQPLLKSANLLVRRSKTSVIISSKSMDMLALNALLGKVLNESYKIQSMKVTKLSETKASLKMEIQL